MGKWGKYEKKYKKSWEDLEQFKGWLQKNNDPNQANQEAYCRICRTGLRAQKNDLEKHRDTKMHRDNASILVKQKPLEACRVNIVFNENKMIDLKLAVYVATHSAVRSIDHSSDLLVQLGKKSTLENLRMHRTKCSKLISNVISPALLLELVKDVGEQPYSLIIDESTDVSVQKYMAVCIRYFSKSQMDITTQFLGIIQITETTAVALYNSLTNYLNEINLPLRNLIGLGTDGASNLCGKNHSLYTLLREQVPQLQIVRCICHSLHLCSSKASEVLPSSLEFLVRESRNWFSNSPLRRAHYAELFGLINDDNKTFLNLVQLSVTRWLAWEGAVKRILYQWLELKTHFEAVAVSNEKCYTARTLSSMYKDLANHLYMIFLKSVLRDVNEANIIFQSTHEDVTKLYETLSTLVMTVASQIIKPAFIDEARKAESRFERIEKALQNELALQSTNSIDYGIEFKNTVSAYSMRSEELHEVKTRCRQYLIVLLTELLKRMPSNMSILKTSTKLSPKTVLCTAMKLKIEDLPLSLLHDPSEISAVESQLRKLPFVDWSDHFPEKIMASTSAFWSHVYMHKNLGGSQPFKELAGLALKILTLPLSNAVVERVFSVMNATKTKPRNKMSFVILDAILRIRTHFHTRRICCKSFVPSDVMYEKFTSKMYDIKVPIAEENQSSSETDSEANFAETMTLFVGEDSL